MSASAIPRHVPHHRVHPRGEWQSEAAVTIRDGICCWTIPAGTRWDYASVPRIGRMLGESTDYGTISSLTHDYLYRRGGRIGRWLAYTRADADRLFKELMAWEQVPWFRRYPAYLAVRVGGRGAWRTTPARKAAA